MTSSSFNLTLENLSSPSKAEKNIILGLEGKLTLGNHSSVLSTLKSKSLAELFLLSENSDKIKEFCETNADLIKRWQKILEKSKYPSHQLVAMNKKYRSSIFERLLATELLGLYKKTQDTAFLDKACSFGLYQALATRINLTIKEMTQFNSGNCSDPTCLKLTQKLVNDANHVSQLYWAPGCVAAAAALTHVLHLFGPESVVLLQAMTECFCRAQQLEKHPQSLKLTPIIYPKAGLLGGFKDFFSEWKDGQDLVLDLLKMNKKIGGPNEFFNKINTKIQHQVSVLAKEENVSAPSPGSTESS